jgi:hypothetical protein
VGTQPHVFQDPHLSLSLSLSLSRSFSLIRAHQLNASLLLAVDRAADHRELVTGWLLLEVAISNPAAHTDECGWPPRLAGFACLYNRRFYCPICGKRHAHRHAHRLTRAVYGRFRKACADNDFYIPLPDAPPPDPAALAPAPFAIAELTRMPGAHACVCVCGRSFGF